MKGKKIACILLTVVLCGSLFAGCSNKASSGSGTGTKKQVLTVNFYSDINAVGTTANPVSPLQTEMKVIIKDFEKQNPGVTVQFSAVPWDQIDSKLVITNQAGNPPDLTFLSSQKLASLTNSGSLMPLDTYVNKDMSSIIDDFVPVEKTATVSTRDEKKYAFLEGVHSRLLYYRKDILPKAPDTWDDVITMSQKYQNPSKNLYGIGLWAGNTYGTMEVYLGPFIWSAGGKITNSDGSAAWNSPEAAKAVMFESDLANKYKVAPKDLLITANSADISKSFLAGNLLMYIDGTYAYPTIIQSDLWKAGKIAFTPIPRMDSSSHSYNFANGWALGIPQKSKNPDLAWKFINYFETPAVQIENAKAEGSLPTRISAWTDKAFNTDDYKLFEQNLKDNGHPMDPLVYYQEGLDALANSAQSYILNPKQDLTKLLDDSAKSFNQKYYSK